MNSYSHFSKSTINDYNKSQVKMPVFILLSDRCDVDIFDRRQNVH